MTIEEAFKQFWPTASNEACDHLLWLTPFPFVPVDRCVESLREMRSRWGDKIGDAIQGEVDAFDAEFRAFMAVERAEGRIA